MEPNVNRRHVNRRPMTWMLAVLIVALPLALVPAGFAPFGPLKWLIVSTLGFSVASALLFARETRGNRRWTAGWLGFLLWGVLASLFAVDPIYTWIGTPDRHLGLVAWVLFAIFFLAGFLTHDRRRVLLNAAVIAMLGIGGYVLLELFGIEPVEVAVTSGRPGGPFGSPAYLGAACSLVLPIVIGVAVDPVGSRRWRVVAWISTALGVMAVLSAQSRAAWAGLVAAMVVAAPALVRWVREHRALVAGAGVALVLVAVVSPIGSRLVSAVDLESGGARGRIDEWRVGTAVLLKHPVAGLGFEGYRIGFAEGVDAAYEQRYGRAFTPDRAHNGALDVGLTAGIPGIAAYVAAAVSLLVAAVRAVRTRKPWLVGLGAGVAGYLAQQQFLFPLVEVDPLFWVFAGVLVAATGGEGRRWSTPPGVWLLPVVLSAAALAAGVLDVGADLATRSALEADQAARRSTALAEIDRAVDLRPDSIRYGFVAASIAARPHTPSGYRLALARIDDALEISPSDPILLAASAGYRLDLAVAERDVRELAAATAALEALVARDPHHAQYRLDLGVGYAVAGRLADAEREWQRAADLSPAGTGPWLNLASLYLDAGRADDAARAIDELRRLDPPSAELRELETRLDTIRRDN
jgi:O-antigen ligase/Flp pilus assembly protein TadD